MIPRPEHPRPQFVRDSWQSLNGEWEFEIDHGNSGVARGLHTPSAVLSQKITLPFCPESKLSGIEHTDFMAAVWYRRSILVTPAQLAGRVLLHIGAADYETHVFVNGAEAGSHKGGYVSFSFDISSLLSPGENSLTIQCIDDNRSGRQPRGKQSASYFSSGCDYTRTTGIWQSVWLEFVPQTYLQRVAVLGDMFGHVHMEASIVGQGKALRIQATALFNGKAVASVSTGALSGVSFFSMDIPKEELHLWDVGQGNLYDIEYALFDGDTCIDRARGYFGLRSIELKNHAIYLNGRPVFQRLVLDQGFYPSGIYTAPSDEALRGDIEISMGLGFNGARLHEKIFEERFLYWADRLGYLVWGEHANWGLDHTRPEALMQFLPEWLEAVKRDISHPAIVGWCPFNETWDIDGRKQDDEVLRGVYLATKQADPSRPVIDTSGNFHVMTDIFDVHDYEQDVATFKRSYDSVTKERIHDRFEQRQRYEGQPFFVSEFGGTWWAPGRSDGWGYGNAPKTEEEFIERFEGLVGALLENEHVCAYCYTQLTDIEQEQNGLVNYARQRKFADEIYARIHKAQTAIAAIEKKEV